MVSFVNVVILVSYNFNATNINMAKTYFIFTQNTKLKIIWLSFNKKNITKRINYIHKYLGDKIIADKLMYSLHPQTKSPF